MQSAPLPFPELVVHADWGSSPQKRWLALAERQSDNSYQIQTPQPVGALEHLFTRLRSSAGSQACILFGVDFPIGLPIYYARRCQIEHFLDLLPHLGQGEWSQFYDVAPQPGDIHLRRPFYPLRAGQARQAHLLTALDAGNMDQLRRQCELAQPGRRPAAPLFWTLGSQQVGKAAIIGWRQVIAPALQVQPPEIQLWPFSGPLDQLLKPGRLVVAETYPAEYYRHFGLQFAPNRHLPNYEQQPRPPGGKRSQLIRRANAAALCQWTIQSGVRLTAKMQADLLDGFGSGPNGEDRFDTFVGLLGMLAVILGQLPHSVPQAAQIRQIEGWILGQPAV